MNTFENAFKQLLLEKKKSKKKKKKKTSSKNKWKPKKSYKNSTYAFYPHGGIGFDGSTGDGGGDGGGGE